MSTDIALVPPAALAALRAKAALADIPTWRPDEGETIEGILYGHRQTQNPFGQMQHQALVQTFDGRITAVWLSVWMIAQLKAQSADMGDLASITYHGMGRSQRGTSYGRYSLTTLKP
jgi:hypothetical protein